METFRWLFPWLLAIVGVAAVLKLDLRLHEPGLAVIAAFVLAGLLSSLRPRLAALWTAVADGGLIRPLGDQFRLGSRTLRPAANAPNQSTGLGITGAEAAEAWADPQIATSAFSILAPLLLSVAITIAGAAAGEAMSQGDKPRSRE